MALTYAKCNALIKLLIFLRDVFLVVQSCLRLSLRLGGTSTTMDLDMMS